MPQTKQDIIKRYTQQGTEAKAQAKRYSGISGTLRSLGEQTGFVSKPDEPFSKLSVGEKAKAFVKELPGSTAQVLKETGKTIAKVPFKVTYSLMDAPRTMATGKAMTTPLRVPGLGEVNTYARDVEQNIQRGMNPIAASTLSGGQAVTDIAGMGLMGQKAMNILSPKKQVLNPKMVKTVIEDASKQVERIAGPNAAAKLSAVDPKHIQSWGDLFIKMRQSVAYDPKLLDTLKNHLQTRWHLYNYDSSTPQFYGKEYVSGMPRPAAQSTTMPLLIRKAFGRNQAAPTGAPIQTGYTQAPTIPSTGLHSETRALMKGYLGAQNKLQSGEMFGATRNQMTNVGLPKTVPTNIKTDIYRQMLQNKIPTIK